MMDFPGARQEPARATKQKIYRMPGTRLEKLARFVYPQRTYNKVFAQALGDLQQEYLEACAAECIWLARWVALRGCTGFWATVVVHAIGVVAGFVKKAWTIAG
jgi:hypothetical protein